MAEDQERILCDEVVRLQEVVAGLMDQGEKDVQSIAHVADAVNRLAVRVTRVETQVETFATAAFYMNSVMAEMLTKIEALEGKGNGNGTETGNEPDGGGVVRDDGPKHENGDPGTSTVDLDRY